MTMFIYILMLLASFFVATYFGWCEEAYEAEIRKYRFVPHNSSANITKILHSLKTKRFFMLLIVFLIALVLLAYSWWFWLKFGLVFGLIFTPVSVGIVSIGMLVGKTFVAMVSEN